MEEKQEESVTFNPGLKSSVSTFSADNESGYEDCDAHEGADTDHTGDLSDVRTPSSKHLEADHETDSLIETTSALTIDSSTR